MAVVRVGNLEFIESTIYRFGYMNILKQNLKQTAEKLGLSISNYFQQDNDQKRTAEKVKLWLFCNHAKLPKTPSESPDFPTFNHEQGRIKKCNTRRME